MLINNVAGAGILGTEKAFEDLQTIWGSRQLEDAERLRSRQLEGTDTLKMQTAWVCRQLEGAAALGCRQFVDDVDA